MTPIAASLSPCTTFRYNDHPAVTRTYGSRNSRAGYPSSPASDPSSPPLPESKRKRPLMDQSSVMNIANPHPTKRAPDDEALHRAHCSRVQRGLEWGKEEEREAAKAGVATVEDSVRIKNGKRGRILHVRADVGGRLARSPTHFDSHGRRDANQCNSLGDLGPEEETSRLIAVDTTSGLFCDPAPLPTPLGIPRIFVPSTHRRQGIASKLLSAAASTFIHGCPLDPSKGDVAFTQPTGDGNAVMRSWGGNGVRIYEE
ncbi:N-acetyltransferase ECO [Salix suchowensis]|nr:N-acetyltransferase ECO [Salix suchowensis]